MKPVSTASRASTATRSRTAPSTSRSVGAAGAQTDSGTTRPSRPKTRARTATSTAGTSWHHGVVCAITESRGVSPTVGLGFVNLSTTEVVLSQIVDNQSYVKTLHKVTVLDPTTLIVPHTAVSPVKSKLMHILQMNLSSAILLKEAPRRYWDESSGVDYIHQFALEDEVEALKITAGGNFFAVCSLAAALKFVDVDLGWTFPVHSMRMRYEPSEGSMLIDLPTIRSLELIQNLQDSRSKDCLFGLLDSTCSPMGSRLLRGNILQPLTTKRDLERRYDAVDDLLAHMEVFTAVRQALKGYLDIDKVLTEIVIIPGRPALVYWAQSINNILLLKQCIRAIPPLHEALTGIRSELLEQIRDLLEPHTYKKVVGLIDDTISGDVTYQKRPVDLLNQRTYAVKTGVNEFLDIARQTYSEATRDAQIIVEELSQTHEMNLVLRYEPGRHHFLSLPTTDLEERHLPTDFINAIRKKHVVECSTLDLVKLNQKIVDAHHEVLQMSEATILKLIDKIRENVAPLFRISDSIALLDMLASFADSAAAREYCRPELLPTLAIKNGRHPIQEKVHRQKFVPNEVMANQKTSRLQIVMGCNMSGKSTYIRSIALMTVMAQAGSFVPATYASIPIRHSLFARLSVDDSSTSGISTFAQEMQEMAFILRNIDPRALVIIDELGRATSTRDGLAIAIAVVEALLQSRALVWFVTHFQDLAKFLAERPGLVNLHLQVDVQERHLSMLYKVVKGPTPPENYGLMVAHAVGLPLDMMASATRVSKAIAEAGAKRAQATQPILEARRAKLLFALKEQISLARDGNLVGVELTDWLIRLQNEFVRTMASLDEEEKELRAPTTSESTSAPESGSLQPQDSEPQQNRLVSSERAATESDSFQPLTSDHRESDLATSAVAAVESKSSQPSDRDYRQSEPTTSDVTMGEDGSFQPLDDGLAQSMSLDASEGLLFDSDSCIQSETLEPVERYLMAGAL